MRITRMGECPEFLKYVTQPVPIQGNCRLAVNPLIDFEGIAGAVCQLAYRIRTFVEAPGQAEDARASHELIPCWPGIEATAATSTSPNVRQ